MSETKRFTLWLLLIVLLLGFIVFFVWLSMRPRPPTYTIVQFSLPTPDYGNSASPVDQGAQNGMVSFELEVENPNKDSGIYYDDTGLTFYYGQETLGQKTILSSYQKKNSRNQIIDHLNIDSRVWNKLIGAISNATAELKVAVLTKIRYRMWGHTSKHQGINLHGKIPIGSDGKISGKKKKIKLHYNSKKWRK
ncbi:protein NDR1-like [Actinidia eriantha]|uniref:protein NDR1-like n=1 Tax=Actinidia eriantha TaxID=165200 RepID=UPI002589AD23|nr:protein NDR1-like [Actinidia eriantha]